MSTSAVHSAYRKVALSVAFGCLCLTIIATPLSAQATDGVIEGSVFITDSDGTRSPVPGIIVTIKGPGTSQQAITDQQAMCRFSGLAPGQYQVEATAPGMSGAAVVMVSPNVVTRVSIGLQIALLKES